MAWPLRWHTCNPRPVAVQEYAPRPFFTMPGPPKTIVLLHCARCGHVQSQVLDGMWVLGELTGEILGGLIDHVPATSPEPPGGDDTVTTRIIG